MSDIGDLVKELVKADKEIKFQLMNNSAHTKEVKGRVGQKYRRLTIDTDVDIMPMDKEAIIIWTTVDKFNAALDKATQGNQS